MGVEHTYEQQQERPDGQSGDDQPGLRERTGPEADCWQQDRLAALGTMTAGFAHEVCSSLTSISALVQVLRRHTWPDEQSTQLEELEEQVNRSIDIGRYLLDFAGRSSSDRVLADLDKLTEQMVTMIRYSHRSKDVRIESIRSRDLPRVCVEVLPVQQAILNILLNAVDAVQECTGEKVVTVRRSACDGWVNVMVVDYGIGMTHNQAGKAFELFYTTKPPGKGTGLGLTISRGLVERQGGTISLNSLPGFGTIAKVSFRECNANE